MAPTSGLGLLVNLRVNVYFIAQFMILQLHIANKYSTANRLGYACLKNKDKTLG